MFDLSLILEEGNPSADGVEARCRIPPESSWFAGHFPSDPVFPALGLLGLVNKLLSAGAHSRAVVFPHLQYRRVRFRSIVRPGEELTLAIAPEAAPTEGRYRFRITRGLDPVSDGVLVTGELPQDLLNRESGPCRVAVRADAPIEKLIPHRDGMRLVDQFEGCDESGDGITRAVVREAWPLCDGTHVHPNVMIELIAQASAATAGWDGFSHGLKPRHGYVVGIKEAWLNGTPVAVGTPLIVRARETLTQGSYGVLSGDVSRENRIIGEAVLQVVRPLG